VSSAKFKPPGKTLLQVPGIFLIIIAVITAVFGAVLWVISDTLVYGTGFMADMLRDMIPQELDYIMGLVSVDMDHPVDMVMGAIGGVAAGFLTPLRIISL